MSLFRRKPKTPEEARKNRSEAWLKAQGVPICDWLPPACEDDCEIRSREAIVDRILGIHTAFVKAHVILQLEGAREDMERAYSAIGGMDHLSPMEREFIEDPKPEQQELYEYHWRIECMYVLWWALNPEEKLLPPDETCDLETMTGQCQEGKLPRDGALRDLAEIRDAFDMYYRLHWAVIDALVNQAVIPEWLEPGIAVQRRRALSWLCELVNDWDDVDMST